MPFEGLREKLLKGGIAPRHVRRYLRELEEHLDDLIQAQRKAGLNESDAAMLARTQLGEDEALAQAMIKQRDFRSISARFPWAVFVLATPFFLLLLFMLMACVPVLIAFASGIIPNGDPGNPIAIPNWYQAAGMIWQQAASLLTGPILAGTLVLIAHRQRLAPTWPIVAAALILATGLRATFSAGEGNIGVGLTSILPFWPKPFGPPAALHWPTFLTQAVLTCAPLFWLTRRQAAKA